MWIPSSCWLSGRTTGSPSFGGSEAEDAFPNQHRSRGGAHAAGKTSEKERTKRQLEGRCFYCGEVGHLVLSCPAKKSQAVSHVPSSSSVPCTLTKVTIMHHTATDLEGLMDSGVDESLMDWGLAKRLGLNSEPLAKPIKASSLNGKELFAIIHISKPTRMYINHHHEIIHFYLFISSSHSLILGQPWLFLHNPNMDWRTGHRRRIPRPELGSSLLPSPQNSLQQNQGPVFTTSSPIRLCHRPNSQFRHSQRASVLSFGT